MTPKRSFLLATVCGLALVAAGCGDDNDTLSYDDTGEEISQICGDLNVQFDELNGQPKHDVPILEKVVPDFEDAVQEVRDLDVDDQLADTRDEFVDNGEQQVQLLKEAQSAAEAGDRKKYIQTFESGESLGKESDALASKLGATECID